MKKWLIIILIFLFSFRVKAQFGPAQIISDHTNGSRGSTDNIALDFDNDGDIDIISTPYLYYYYYNSSIDGLFYYENIGNEQFNEPVILSENSTICNQLEALDVDDDGDKDVIGISYEEGLLVYFENSGFGDFSSINVIDSFPSTSGFQLSDIDGDAKLDIVLRRSGSSHNKFWYKNNGNGDFSNKQVFIESTLSGDLYLEDFDGDNDIDAIYTYRDNIDDYFKMAFVKNMGDGNFENESTIIDSSELVTYKTVVADLDEDDNIDLLVQRRVMISSNVFESRILWFRNNGDASFSSINLGLDPDTYPELGGFIEDIDQDGDLDILININSNTNNYNTPTWFLNDGLESFSHEEVITMPLGANLIADLDNDGDQDVVSTIDGEVWLENIANNFETIHPISRSVGAPSKIVMADSDNDGDEDMIVAGTYRVASFINDDNQFQEYNLIKISNVGSNGMQVSDIDGDGDLDIVSANYESIDWNENLGNNVFSAPHFIDTMVQSSSYGFNNMFEVMDFDNDGDDDIFYAVKYQTELFLFKNDGLGNFEDGIDILAGPFGPYDIGITDLDMDGDIDIIMTGWEEKIVWLENNSSGGFNSISTLVEGGQQYIELKLGDIDGDGDIDIVSSAYDSTYNYIGLKWYQNDGNENFASGQSIIDSIGYMEDMLLEDYDNDGDLDLFTVGQGILTNAYYKNDGTGQFEQMLLNLNPELYHSSVEMYDFNEDGDLDLIITDYSTDKIAYYENLVDEDIAFVNGQIYWDKDQDSTYSQGDEVFQGIALEMQPDGSTFYTNQNGEFSAFTVENGTHTLTVEAPFKTDCLGEIDFQLVLPESQPFTFPFVAFQEIEQDFVFNGPTDNCFEVSGQVFSDANENGIKDSGENGLGGILVTTNNYGNTYSMANGNFNYSVPNNESLTIGIDLFNNSTNGYCSSTITVLTQTLPSNNQDYNVTVNNADVDTLEFGVHGASQGTFDVGLYSLVVQNGNEAGKAFHAYSDFKAEGIITEACTLRIEHDPLISLLQASIPPTNETTTYVEWIFSPGTAPSAYCMQMDWYLDAAAVAGDTLHWEEIYECPPDIDDCPANNKLVRDVIVLEGPLRLANEHANLYSMRPEGIMPEIVKQEEVLSYVVTFQNPLPTTAYNVILIDTLPDEIDFATVSQPFSSFPNYDFRITEEGVIIMEFKGIDLENAEEDELNSYGFVQFNAILKDGLAEGTLIPNKATVFFNGISPKVTNEVIHKIDQSVPVKNEILNNIEISIYPNPFSNHTTFRLGAALPFNYDLKVFDVLGKQVQQYLNNSATSLQIRKQNLPSGIYFLNVYENERDEVLGSWKLVVE